MDEVHPRVVDFVSVAFRLPKGGGSVRWGQLYLPANRDAWDPVWVVFLF